MRKTSVRYASEVRERAVRMVGDHAADHASRWAAIRSIASKTGYTAFATGLEPVATTWLTAEKVGPRG